MSDNNSVIIYTNLFTLKGKDVKTNKYIDMYYIWLHNIIKYAQLKHNDCVITFIDRETYDIISKSFLFGTLASKLDNFKVFLYEQPSDIKTGILQRYNIKKMSEIVDKEAYILHLDIDVLVISDIRNIFEVNFDNCKTTIYLKKEGIITDPQYYGIIMTPEDHMILNVNGLQNMPGFSAGIYGWKNSKDIMEYFEFILEMAKKETKELYTVEQPFFNAAVFNFLFKKTGIFNFVLLDNDLVGHNLFCTQVESKKTTLLNFCGIPGDDSFHWEKMFIELLLSSITRR